MKPRDYFPLGKAYGQAFCNRKAEIAWLLSNIEACKHSLLIAPRRFGKSSLAEHVIAQCQRAAITVNFNTCADEHDIEWLIRQSVTQLIGKSLGSIDKMINSIKNYTKNFTPTLTFGQEYAQLTLSTTNKIPASAKIEESLMLIEQLLAEKKRFAVMQFDEFQMVGLIAKGRGVEAAIRNVAQDVKYLSFIFSGSIRRLLLTMFEDESRPLYKLCRKLHLPRIAPEHYLTHLNHAAQLAWKKKLGLPIIDHILLLSECHPYYVNYLCDILWTNCPHTPPQLKDIDHAWQQLIEEESSDANKEIANLSLKQKKLLKFIATNQEINLMSMETTKNTALPLSTIASALTALTNKDILDKQHDKYTIINPVIRHVLVNSL